MNGVPEAQSENIKFSDDSQGDSQVSAITKYLSTSKEN